MPAYPNMWKHVYIVLIGSQQQMIKWPLKTGNLSLVVRYRTDTRQIWQATEFKSEGKSHQIIMDRPTSKERTHAAHRLVTSATITCNCMSQSPHYAVVIAKEASVAFTGTSKLPPNIHKVQGLSQVFVDIQQHYIGSGVAESLMTSGRSLSGSWRKRIFPQWKWLFGFIVHHQKT